MKPPFLEPEALSIFSISLCPEEVSPTMPRKPKPDDLSERIAIVEKTTITWQQLFLSLGVIIAVITFVTSLFYKSLLTNQIETGISNSAYLAKSFSEIEKQVVSVNARLDKIISASPILNTKILSAVLKDATSGDSALLISSLPNVRNILTIAREKRVPLPDQDYREISRPLLAKYDTAKPPLKHELWLTLVELANTRTSTDAVLHPITNAEIAQAEAVGNFFEGKNIDLSSRTTWKDTIFRNCKFSISQPGKDLTFAQVRFIDSEFQPIAENKAGLNLFKFLIQSDGPKVSADVVKFKVGPITATTNSPS